MAELTDTSVQECEPVVRVAPIALGLVLFVILEAVVPLFWTFFVPVVVSPAGRWTWVVGSALAAAGVIRRGDMSDRPGATFFSALLCLSAVVAIVAAASLGVNWLLGRVSHVEAWDIPSPSRRLVAVVESTDVGAWAPIQSGVYVRGRLVPGVLEWRYPIRADDVFPDSVRWADDSALVVNGEARRIPPLIVLLAW